MKSGQAFTDGKAIVQLVLPPSWVGRINRLAVERGMNRSALIREAIARAYFEEQVEGGREGGGIASIKAGLIKQHD